MEQRRGAMPTSKNVIMTQPKRVIRLSSAAEATRYVGRGVRARCVANSEAVVNVAPVIGTGVGGIDADLLDDIDRLEHALDLGQPDWRRYPRPGRTYGAARTFARRPPQNVEIKR